MYVIYFGVWDCQSGQIEKCMKDDTHYKQSTRGHSALGQKPLLTASFPQHFLKDMIVLAWSVEEVYST